MQPENREIKSHISSKRGKLKWKKKSKSLFFQNGLSFQKNYAPKMQDLPFADGVNSLSPLDFKTQQNGRPSPAGSYPVGRGRLFISIARRRDQHSVSESIFSHPYRLLQLRLVERCRQSRIQRGKPPSVSRVGVGGYLGEQRRL